MFNINLFTFKYKKEVLEFITAIEAIKYFNKCGYGMANWKITVDYADSGVSEISLKTFNHITDTQLYIDSLKHRIK